jgi:hypothetical protein
VHLHGNGKLKPASQRLVVAGAMSLAANLAW